MAEHHEKNSERPYLYLITPPVIDDIEAFAAVLDAALTEQTVASVQLRLKGVDDEVVIAAAERLMPVAHKHEVAFIINDSVAITAAVDADGVHLGQGDGDVREARSALGYEKAIGVTCHDSIDLAFTAGDQGADYVAFGAFFETTTKPSKFRPEADIIEHWVTATELPCVAIGGITPANVAPLIKNGAHFIAVCSYVWNHADGPAAAVAEFETLFAG